MRDKRTKIVATIADTHANETFIQELYEAGVDAIRLNTAHQTVQVAEKTIQKIRKTNPHLAILLDTKGPEIRTNKPTEPTEYTKGNTVHVSYSEEKESNKEHIYVTYKDFVKDIEPQTKILIDDGLIELEVQEKNKDTLTCKIIHGGTLTGRKGVNTPGSNMQLESLTTKDKEYLELAKKHSIDFIAHSFVRNKKDIQAVKKILGPQSTTKIIAKIENEEGVQNIETILDEAHGIMVARGDLGIEIPPEKVPVIQKQIIKTCITRAKPVIIATQMLESMIHNPRPTRAESSDVANAIYDGADAIMLSGETAYGKYPLEAVRMMSKIACNVEPHLRKYRRNKDLQWENDLHSFFAQQAIYATSRLPIQAIIAVTKTGATARVVSSFRGIIPVYAVTFNETTKRELMLSYGITPTHLTEIPPQEEEVQEAIKLLKKEKKIQTGELILVVGSTPGKVEESGFLEVFRA